MYERNENHLSRRIRALPTLEPPEEARERVLGAMAAAADAIERPSMPARIDGYQRWAMAAGLAAISVLAALIVMSAAPNGDELGASERDATVTDYRELVERSRQLEFVLANLPAQRRVMRADTAATIALLETQIELIDEQLSLSAAAKTQPELRHALWRDRVDAMDALVQVRYAQSEVFTF